MISKQDLTSIGKTIKPHGISGEILCEFSLVIDDDNLPKYLIIDDEGIMVPFFIENFRGKAKFSVFVTFEHIDDEAAARRLCGKEIFTDVDFDQNDEIPEYGLSFLVGFAIVDKRHGNIGEITDIDDSTINTLFVVGDTLVPAHEEFITEIDTNQRIIYTTLPEGLLDI